VSDPASGDGVAADTEARDLLERLVSIPSPTPEEDDCADALASFFEAHDRDVFRDEVGNVRAPADDSVLYTSHVDTVPGDIPVRIEDGENGPELWGRGSVDAKGPLAALAVAAVRTGVSFVGVVGEEVDSRGARHLVADRAAPDAVVNGEPSGGDGITLGYRGILSGTYRCTSESGHTSRPENQRDPGGDRVVVGGRRALRRRRRPGRPNATTPTAPTKRRSSSRSRRSRCRSRAA